jgi:hypothetical protein
MTGDVAPGLQLVSHSTDIRQIATGKGLACDRFASGQARTVRLIAAGPSADGTRANGGLPMITFDNNQSFSKRFKPRVWGMSRLMLKNRNERR